MTHLEALERARVIWPGIKALSLVQAPPPHPPGAIQWWVEGGHISHMMDCNGHTLCHDDCAELEVQRCK